jgi:hypothetical protein
MINLRRPLEGVPGLLLLAALVLFGATIGVSLALMCHWVTMQAEVANFLGGVVGAGLGAALAVMGAIYVQRRDARERIAAPINEFNAAVADLPRLANALLSVLESTKGNPENPPSGMAIRDAYENLIKALGRLPEGAELPAQAHRKILFAKRVLPTALKPVDSYTISVGYHKRSFYDDAVREARRAVAALEDLWNEAERL